MGFGLLGNVPLNTITEHPAHWGLQGCKREPIKRRVRGAGKDMILWCKEGPRLTLPGKCDVPRGREPSWGALCWEDLVISLQSCPSRKCQPRAWYIVTFISFRLRQYLGDACPSPATPSFVEEERELAKAMWPSYKEAGREALVRGA